MRILFVSTSSAMSGAPAALLNLVLGLRELGHECAVVLPSKRGALVNRLADAGISIYTDQPYELCIYPLCFNPIKKSKRMKRLKERSVVFSYFNYVIDDFSPDIVHTNVGPFDVAARICKEKGIAHIWHLREYQDLDFGMKFYPSKESFMELIHGDWNRCIAITRGIYSHWQLGLKDRVIYDGVFDENHLPAADTDNPGEQYFFYAARIEKAKGFHILAKAFKRFASERNDWKLVVAGRSCGLYSFWWKMYCRLLIPRRQVKFYGYTDKVAELMSRAAACVIPSRCEGFGFTTAEAMLNGCTVIGRNTAGTREQFDNGLSQSGREIGIRFGNAEVRRTSKLVEDLYGAMELVASKRGEDSLKAMRKAARKVVIANYGAHRCAKQVEDFYKEVLAEFKGNEAAI